MKNRIYLVLALSLFVTIEKSAQAKGGGSGVSNGGGAVFCENSTPQMLDTFLIRHKPIPGPYSRSRFFRKIRSLLRDFDPEFSRTLQKEWSSIGNSKKWENRPESRLRSYDEYLPFDISQLKNCKFHQIASFEDDGWIPEKVELYYNLLPDFEKRVLELHESLYIMGARDFYHTNPTRTRKLIEVLLLGESEKIKDSIQEFKTKHLRNPDGTKRVYDLGIVFREKRNDLCPASLLIEELGKSGIQFGLIPAHDDRGLIRKFVSIGFSEKFTLSLPGESHQTSELIDPKRVVFKSEAYEFSAEINRIESTGNLTVQLKINAPNGLEDVCTYQDHGLPGNEDQKVHFRKNSQKYD